MLNKIVLAAATVAVAFSASADFIPTAGTPTYTTAANWDGNNINGVFSRTQTGAYTILFPADTTLATGLNFNQNMATFAATLRGDGGNRTLTLGGDISVNVTGNATRSVGIGGGANTNLNINPGGNRTFNVTRAGDLLSITNTLVGGSGDITKTGAGTLILSNSSHDVGDIYVNEGILQAQAAISGPTKKAYLGATSGSASATLRVTGILTNGVEVRAGSTGDIVYRSNANNDSGISGGISLNRDLTVSLLSGAASPNSRGLSLSGAISGNGGLIVTGGGTTNPGSLTLSGSAANTYAGLTDIKDGILLLNKTGVNAIAGNVMIGDGIVDGVNDALTLLAANQIADTSALTIAPTASLNLEGLSDLVAATTIASGGGISTGTGGTLFTNALTINNVSIPNGVYTASSPSFGGINFADYIRGTGSVVVPEPTSLSLLGLVGLASLRRRK